MNNGRKIRLPTGSGDWGRTLAQYVDKHQFFFRNRDSEEDLAEGRFYLGEDKASGSSVLIKEQPLYFFEPPWQEPEIRADIPIVFENESLLVVDKPPGIPTTPSGPFYESCLLHRLRRNTGKPELSPCHRLDIETSGLICFAKAPEVRGFFQKQFQEGTAEKRYLAMTFGNMLRDTVSIELPLGRDSRVFTKFVPHPQGKPARTRIRSLHHWRGYSILEIEPITGRTNQIRAHLAAIGHPIVGDKKYFPDPELFLDWVAHRNFENWRHHLKLSRQALHCDRLRLRSPSGEHELRSARNVVAEWKSEIHANDVTAMAGAISQGVKKTQLVATSWKHA